MNEPLQPHSMSDVPWPTSGQRVPAPAASVLNGSDDTAAEQLADGVSAVQQAMHEEADTLRKTGDVWAEGLRTTVRSNPLACLAAALAAGAAGAVIARLARSPRDMR